MPTIEEVAEESYNVGDKVYYIQHDVIQSGEIIRIDIHQTSSEYVITYKFEGGLTKYSSECHETADKLADYLVCQYRQKCINSETAI